MLAVEQLLVSYQFACPDTETLDGLTVTKGKQIQTSSRRHAFLLLYPTVKDEDFGTLLWREYFHKTFQVAMCENIPL